MELELTADQSLFADTSRQFLDDRAPITAVRDLRGHERGYDEDFWRQGCELGWTSLLVAEHDGGGTISGESILDLMIVAHEFGRHAAPGPLIGTNVVASALSRSGSPGQRALLADLVSGVSVAAWAHAEPRPNDRLGVVTARATPTEGGWSLSGTKTAVEAGTSARHLLVTARVDTGGLTQFLVPAQTPGVSIVPMSTVDLTRRFAEVTFDDAVVAADAVVGEPDGADEDVAHQLRVANVIQCAEMTGALDRALEITLEWVMDRYSFGRPLGSYQAIKHRLADMKTWLEASHAIADSAARAVQHDTEDADELCSGAKAYIGHHGPELCHECVQFHGGIGVTFEHDLHVYLRRVVVDATTHGTVTDHRLRLADMLDPRRAEAPA